MFVLTQREYYSIFAIYSVTNKKTYIYMYNFLRVVKPQKHSKTMAQLYLNKFLKKNVRSVSYLAHRWCSLCVGGYFFLRSPAHHTLHRGLSAAYDDGYFIVGRRKRKTVHSGVIRIIFILCCSQSLPIHIINCTRPCLFSRK